MTDSEESRPQETDEPQMPWTDEDLTTEDDVALDTYSADEQDKRRRRAEKSGDAAAA